MKLEHRHKNDLGWYCLASRVYKPEATLLKKTLEINPAAEWRLVEARAITDIEQRFRPELYYAMNETAARTWMQLVAPYHLCLINNGRIGDALVAMNEMNLTYWDYWQISPIIATVTTTRLREYQYSQLCCKDQTKQVEWKLRYADTDWLKS